MRMLPVGIANPQLYLRHWHDLLQGEARSIPKVQSKVIGGTRYQILMLQELKIKYLTLVGIDLVQQRGGVGIVDLESGTFPLD